MAEGMNGSPLSGTSSPSTTSPFDEFLADRTSSAPGAETSTRPGANASTSFSMRRASSGTATDAESTAANSSKVLSPTHIAGLEARGIDPEVAIRYGLHTIPEKFGGRDGLAIPFVREGRVVNHEYRGPGKQFQQDKDAPRSFWNEDCLRDPSLRGLPLVISEGPLDALSFLHVHPLTVSVPNGASTNLDFLADLMPLLDEVPRVILAGDGDDPGKRLNAELARRLGAARCAWVEYPEGAKDGNDVLKVGGVEALRALLDGAKPYPIKGLFRLSDYPDAPPPELYGTGWINLNPFLKLWTPEFVVITGVPNHGKSTWALNLCANLAEEHGHRVLVASFEMPIVPYVRDVLRNYRGGEVADADRWIEEQFMFLDQDPREEEMIDVEWVIEKAQDAVIRYGIKWLLIDPWNQLEHSRGRLSLEEYQEQAIRSLKRFAKAWGVGVMVVAHPTKDVKDKSGQIRTPTLYDIAGSAHWYNAADHGVVIDRPDTAGNETRVIVKKSRFKRGGVPGEAWLKYDETRGRFSPLAKLPEGQET
jgi:twinkle protein